MLIEIIAFACLGGILAAGIIWIFRRQFREMADALAQKEENARQALLIAVRERIGELQTYFQQEFSLFRQELQAASREETQVLLKQAQEGSQAVQRSLLDFSANLSQRTEAAHQMQQQVLHQLQSRLQETLDRLGQRIEERLDAVRATVEGRLRSLQEDNAVQLDRIRHTVDERLQNTLDKRLSESFSVVSERLELVQRGLGEMQSLASGVGELKRVLTNVKQRGTWAEIQLGVLISEMLAPHQYAVNVKPDPQSREVVEYAIRLPGREGESEVWLPVDSKFPMEDYQRLVEASERGDSAAVEVATREVRRAVIEAAKEISQKYLRPPRTTDFAIMYLPTEGLYAEAVRQVGLVQELQQKYRVVVAGPTTFTALLNSLQIGFKTLAIQEQSARVWRVLNEVRVEFGKFAEWVGAVKARFDQASKELEKVETRTRAVERKLQGLGTVGAIESEQPVLRVGEGSEGE
ncbi:MAG: DNA recombination protein RmuC [Methylacidiphilales bacterium]|nr:DNA recombination protein RmuC [Candidatus Methylacidiphilales bacterium]MDW8349204.1 DNA recombination protein RmuC [Verrucomicrobiae bacterium]